MIEIRPAALDDLDTLLAFEQAIAAYERPFTNSLKNGEIHYYNLVELIESDKVEILVAVSGNEIVGSGYAKIETSRPYEKSDEHGYLGFMFVKPSFRRKGINHKILSELLNWSKSKGLSEVRLEVLPENRGAKDAYLKAGFESSLLEMRLEIE